MTAIPKFIFMFYRYMGFTCISSDDFNKKITFSVGRLGFHAIEKNAQQLQVGIHQNWTQHTLVDRKQQKTLYMSKNKVVCPGAWTIISVHCHAVTPLETRDYKLKSVL